MRFIPSLLATASLLLQHAAAQKSVFAHVVVGNTAAHDQSTWASDIALAKASGIDAFALNMGFFDQNIAPQVAHAFAAAEAAGSGFKLFFSFDYLGGGQPWPATGTPGSNPPDSVASYLLKYKDSPAYFKFNNAAFASTFEGPGNGGDWAPGGRIRSAVGSAIYFVPDYSSLGPGGIGAQLNNIEGFFSWDMWPNGAQNKTDTVDKSWQAAIGGKSYMMGVSPWFFHSASGGKDWVWRGDDLWADRWAQTLDVKPQFVQIVTWNDYGEAHYVGPLPASASEIAQGSGPYVNNMPHDAWRNFLPFYIAAYKGNPLTPSKDQVQYWYRLSPVTGGNICGVVGNNADQKQTELSPNAVMEDGVYFSAILKSAAQVTVQIGGGPVVTKQGVAGINHWSVPLNGQLGVPTISVVRNGATTSSGKGAEIKANTNLSNGCVNYNAWVGGFDGQ